MSTLFVNIVLLLGLSKIAKLFHCYVLIVIGLIMAATSLLLSSTIIYSGYVEPLVYASFWTFVVILLQFSTSLITVTILGRISRLFPAGFESTGITLIIAISNISYSLGQFLSADLVESYGVKAGYYMRFMGPQTILVGSIIALIASTPIFLPI